jgi:hypothetical protein
MNGLASLVQKDASHPDMMLAGVGWLGCHGSPIPCARSMARVKSISPS